MTQTSTDLQAVAAALRDHDRFLVVTHENPDGDALGSLLATTLALRQLGKDVEMLLMGETPLPREYHFLHLDGLLREPLLERSSLVVNIDHHHDNTRFGDVNLIAATACSTGELLRDVFAEIGVELTPEIAEPLYVARSEE